MFPGVLTDILFDGLPEVEDLAAAERADVVNSFEKDSIFEAVPNRACVVLDARGQLFGRQIGL
jgi:hypothetical protein